MHDISPRHRPAATSTEPAGAGALLTDINPVASALLARLDAEHPTLSRLSRRERLLAAAWLSSYRSARTRRAYAGDLAAWLHWLCTCDVDVLDARRIHVDLWIRHLLDAEAASSSTSRRRLSALSSFYRHLLEHELIAASSGPLSSPVRGPAGGGWWVRRRSRR